jgi:hypothetical protein
MADFLQILGGITLRAERDQRPGGIAQREKALQDK